MYFLINIANQIYKLTFLSTSTSFHVSETKKYNPRT